MSLQFLSRPQNDIIKCLKKELEMGLKFLFFNFNDIRKLRKHHKINDTQSLEPLSCGHLHSLLCQEYSFTGSLQTVWAPGNLSLGEIVVNPRECMLFQSIVLDVGLSPFPVVTTRIFTCLAGDPYKPSISGKGGQPFVHVFLPFAHCWVLFYLWFLRGATFDHL